MQMLSSDKWHIQTKDIYINMYPAVTASHAIDDPCFMCCTDEFLQIALLNTR